MGQRDERVDAYIEKSADFAKPILMYIRELVHSVCPNVKETLKWGFPHFDYEGIFCSMAAFKEHASFGFWKHSLIVPNSESEGAENEKGMGSFGRVTKISDLPSKKLLTSYLKKGMELNEAGVKSPTRSKPKTTPKTLEVHPEFAKALKTNAAALATFEGFSPSNKREYADWVNEAKTEATRERRIATAIEWMAEGKRRNWKYENC
jgi:uncharacterized protein YdeI (YjbR/CyaY-like superfamily)